MMSKTSLRRIGVDGLALLHHLQGDTICKDTDCRAPTLGSLHWRQLSPSSSHLPPRQMRRAEHDALLSRRTTWRPSVASGTASPNSAQQRPATPSAPRRFFARPAGVRCHQRWLVAAGWLVLASAAPQRRTAPSRYPLRPARGRVCKQPGPLQPTTSPNDKSAGYTTMTWRRLTAPAKPPLAVLTLRRHLLDSPSARVTRNHLSGGTANHPKDDESHAVAISAICSVPGIPTLDPRPAPAPARRRLSRRNTCGEAAHQRNFHSSGPATAASHGSETQRLSRG